jgi:hypothetical protein
MRGLVLHDTDGLSRSINHGLLHFVFEPQANYLLSLPDAHRLLHPHTCLASLGKSIRNIQGPETEEAPDRWIDWVLHYGWWKISCPHHTVPRVNAKLLMPGNAFGPCSGPSYSHNCLAAPSN